MLMGFCSWYFFDAISASTHIENLLLICPAILLALVLFFVIVIQEINIRPSDSSSVEADKPLSNSGVRRPEVRIVLFMALLGTYVITMPMIGFDRATFLFISLGLALQGEFRLKLLIGYSLVFAALITFAFKIMLSVPVPTLVR